jgi:hypothetical protein
VTDGDAFALRHAAMAGVLNQTQEDLVSHFIAVRANENPQEWANRVYARLEQLPAHDLALAVVIALSRDADDKANELWQHLWSDRAEDIR